MVSALNIQVFTGISHMVRSDQSFLEQHDESHRKGLSPVQECNVHLVPQFALGPMNILCLGVVRALLYRWVLRRKESFKLSLKCMEKLSYSLQQIAG